MDQLVLLRIVCLVIGYVFGMFQTAYILGRSKGIDIREHGSGNAGTTNAMRILGKKAGLIVFLGDLLKSLLALLLVGFLFGKSHPEAVYLLKTWTFAGVVLGHDYPVYMNFKGGKGCRRHGGICLRFSLDHDPHRHPAVFHSLSDHKICFPGIAASVPGTFYTAGNRRKSEVCSEYQTPCLLRSL